MPTKIDLQLPKQWNQCSTEQLELIADIIHEQVAKQNRYRPFSMQTVKTALFFALSGIEIVEGPNPRVPVEEQYYTCRLSRHRSIGVRRWLSRCLRSIGSAVAPHFPCRNFVHSLFRSPFPLGEGWGEASSFHLYLWQINYWVNGSPIDEKGNIKKTNRKQKNTYNGILSWLDRDSGIYLTKFPYPTLSRRHHSRFFSLPKTFKGPSTDLADFSWAQYRLASEAMQTYVQMANSLERMKALGSFSPEQMMKQMKNVDLARALFLATIFIKKTKFVDTTTGIIKCDFHYVSNQTSDNAEFFRSFPDTQWQVILFWWEGVMHALGKRYPHVFKVQKVDKKTPSSPMEIYTATIATMQKYVGIDENQCNNQSYALVLEQLERMAKENDELEKIRKKK